MSCSAAASTGATHPGGVVPSCFAAPHLSKTLGIVPFGPLPALRGSVWGTLQVSFLRESVHIMLRVMVPSCRVRWLQTSRLITGRSTWCSLSGLVPLWSMVPHPATSHTVSAATSLSSRWKGSTRTSAFSSAFSSSCHKARGDPGHRGGCAQEPAGHSEPSPDTGTTLASASLRALPPHWSPRMQPETRAGAMRKMEPFGHSSKVFGGKSRDGPMGQGGMDRGTRPSLAMRISSGQSVTLQIPPRDRGFTGCARWGGGSHQPPAHLEEEKVILVVVDVAARVGELGAHLVQAFVGLRFCQRMSTQQHLEEFPIPGRESECGTNSWGCHCTQPWKWGAVGGQSP